MKIKKIILIVLGCICLGCGCVGIVLPILCTAKRHADENETEDHLFGFGINGVWIFHVEPGACGQDHPGHCMDLSYCIFPVYRQNAETSGSAQDRTGNCRKRYMIFH